MATRKPATYHCAATRWSLDDLVAALAPRRPGIMSRSSIWRLLEEADLKPHRSVYWLKSHDPDFEAKAHDICSLYLHALRCFEHGRVVICTDEKTEMQILQRTYPTQPMVPGKPEKREHPMGGMPIVSCSPNSATPVYEFSGRTGIGKNLQHRSDQAVSTLAQMREEIHHAAYERTVVYLSPADKSHKFPRRLSKGQKVLQERALLASQRPSEPW
jgi:hypothetical protein